LQVAELLVRSCHHLYCVGNQVSLDELVQLGESLLDVTIGQLLVRVHIKRGVGVHLEQPGVQIFVDQDVQAQDLEAARVRVVGANETVISVLQVRLEGDDRLLSDVPDLLQQVARVFALVLQRLEDGSKQLLRRFIIVLKLLARGLETVGVLIQREVGQVHVQVLDVVLVWLLVVVRAEPSQAFAAHVGLHGVHSADQDV